MTVLISIFGFIGRAAGRLLTTALGWASSLLFGRVPQSHQIFVTMMMAGSLLWVAVILLTLVPGVTPVLLDSTPHPAFIGLSLVRFAILLGLLALPVLVGLAGYLAPAREERPGGLAAVRQVLTGYPIALLMTAVLIFLAGVGAARKAGNAKRGWSDTHIPIVVKPGGYDQMANELRTALAVAGLRVASRDAPRVLAVPGQLLAALAGSNVRMLVPDRLTRLIGPDLSIDLYPSDIAISGTGRQRMRSRIAIISRILWTSAHLTTSAEAQAVEDRLERIESRVSATGTSGSTSSAVGGGELAAVDRTLLDAELPVEEWDILYRLRLQVERDVLAAGRAPVRRLDGLAAASPTDAAPQTASVAH